MYDVCMHVVQIHLYQILYVTICSLVQLIAVTDLIVLSLLLHFMVEQLEYGV